MFRPSGRVWTLAAGVLVIAVLATGCRGETEPRGRQIAWQPGTPPPELAVDGSAATEATTDPVVPPGDPTVTEPTPTAEEMAPTEPTATIEPTPAFAEGPLTAAQRVEIQPNELGVIPVLMYHDIIDVPETKIAYTRTLDDFKAELQRLYDQGYYIVPLRDVVLNRIAAPAGKHPVVLTFDDGIANQFRYLEDADGTVTIDPTSAVGVLEAFSAEHPDFGRGGFFAVPPDRCFDWTAEKSEPDQTPYCGEKLRWLLDNGYEVGNHTLGHTDLRDIDDRTFMEMVGRGWTDLQEQDPTVEADILAMPFGNYPDLDKRREQRRMMREGFEYGGTFIKLLGALQVGAEPAVSPVSTEWDPLFIARVQAYDGEYGSDEWLAALADDPARRYTSDGDPETVSVPAELPPALDGTLDRERTREDGKTLIVYDPTSGEAA